MGSSPKDSRHLLGINNKSLQKVPRRGPRWGSAAVPKEVRAGSEKEWLSRGRVLQHNVGHLTVLGRADIAPLLGEGSFRSDYPVLHSFKDLHHFFCWDAAFPHDDDATFPEGERTNQGDLQRNILHQQSHSK